MWRRKGFAACGILLAGLCAAAVIVADGGSAFAASDNVLLINTINRTLRCTYSYDCGWPEGGQHDISPGSTWTADYAINSHYAPGRWCPMVKLWCMDAGAYTDAVTVTLDVNARPTQCRLVRTDRKSCCLIEKMEIQCP